MSATHVTTHGPDALARLMEQYKGKPLIAGVLGAFTAQVQAIEDALWGTKSGQTLAAAVGAQLDKVGGVLGLTRQPAWTDAIYRPLLYAQLGQNVSTGDAESIISIYAAILQAGGAAPSGFFQNLYPASFMIMAAGSLPDPSLVDIVKNFLDGVASAGVRVENFGSYDPVNPFCFAGGKFLGGFGNYNDPTVGGKLAALYVP